MNKVIFWVVILVLIVGIFEPYAHFYQVCPNFTVRPGFQVDGNQLKVNGETIALGDEIQWNSGDFYFAEMKLIWRTKAEFILKYRFIDPGRENILCKMIIER